MSDKSYLVVTAVPNMDDMASMQSYVQQVGPLLIQAGGQALQRFKFQEVIHGELPGAMLLVMAFDGAESIRTLFASDAYLALIPARDKGFKSINISIASDFPMP